MSVESGMRKTILLDYMDGSNITITDSSNKSAAPKVTSYVGLAGVKSCFTMVWGLLKGASDVSVISVTTDDAARKIYLSWKAPSRNIYLAKDVFYLNSNFKIVKQTVAINP